MILHYVFEFTYIFSKNMSFMVRKTTSSTAKNAIAATKEAAVRATTTGWSSENAQVAVTMQVTAVQTAKARAATPEAAGSNKPGDDEVARSQAHANA